MANPITWYLQARTIDDDQSILEAIDAKILTHNQDPSGHGQSSESLWEHRVQPLLDHINYSIYNVKTAFQARTVKAFVGEAGVSEYGDIQSAIDYVSLHGGGRVFIQNGTYVLTANIVIPSNVKLEGESMEGVLIDCNAGAFGVSCQGSATEAGDGTITVTKDSATIEGAGTDFEAQVEVDDFIRIDDQWYQVASITDGDTLVLRTTYRGYTRAGLSYGVITPKQNVDFDSITVTNAGAAWPLKFSYLHNSHIKRARVMNGSSGGMYFNYLSDCSVRDCYSENNGGYGILINSCQSTYFIGLSANSNDQLGIQIQGSQTSGIFVLNSNADHNDWGGFKIIGGEKATYLGCTAIGNDDAGFNLTGVDYCNLSNCFAEKNNGDGILLDNNVDYCRFMTNTLLDNADWGMQINGGASSNDKNVVVGNVILGNSNGQLNDLGTATDKGHNIVA